MPTQAVLADEFRVERSAIRQALKHLQEDGLLTAVTRGAPARVAAVPGVLPGADGPLQTSAALGPRVLEAFGVPDVRIDALCLTAESLALAIAEPVQRIRSGLLAPRSVRVRILLPAHDLDVEVSLREIPFTPPMKLYLLNGDEALFAYYTVEMSTCWAVTRPSSASRARPARCGTRRSWSSRSGGSTVCGPRSRRI